MRTWKKAFSAGLAAMLLASVTASAAFATKGAAATDSDQTDHLACTNAVIATLVTCSQVADGISTVTLTGDATDDAAGISLYISVSGATFISAAGDFVLGGGIVTDADPVNLLAADTITLRAPAAPGSAVVSVYEITTLTGIAALEGTLTITFTASSGLGVSVANSAVKIVAPGTCTVNGTGTGFTEAAVTSGPANPSNATVARLCILVNDGNGNPLANGTAVTGTITPIGGLQHVTPVPPALGVFGQTSGTTTLGGVASFNIFSTGLAGTATIAVSVTVGTTTTSFLPVTFIFTGPIATVTASNKVFALDKTAGATADVVEFTAKDAAGNFVPTVGATAVSSDVTILTVGSPVAQDFTGADTAAGRGKVTVDCVGVAGSATVKVTAATIASNLITVYCSDAAAVTVTVAFSATTINPGGSATLTLTAKDGGLRPVPDGTGAALIVSAGATTPVTTTTNGMATATYLAPFNTGVVTALGTVSGVTGSGSTTIGPVVPVTPVTGTNASALGVSHSATYSTATKVAALNTYQTFKISFGASAAGTTVGILVATKTGSTWSSFTRLTGRVADSTGTAWFSWRNAAASWISVRGDFAGNLSNAVQARWR